MSRQERAPLRIIAHNGAPEWGGAEIALADLLLGLESRGHEVTLLCNRALVAETARARGVDTRLLRLGGDLAVHDALYLAWVLRRERPDAFIIGTFRKLWLAALAARWAKVPNLVARIGLSSDTPRNFKYRFVLKRWVDQVVFGILPRGLMTSPFHAVAPAESISAVKTASTFFAGAAFGDVI